MKIAFLDRDGTIIKDYAVETWRTIKTPEFMDGSIEAMQKMTLLGYKIIIITNQYLIDEGYISEEAYLNFTDKFLNILKTHDVDILDIFYCPHSRESGCECCKPKTGLIEQACKKYTDINMLESFMCGDSLCDLELAKKVGLKFFGIGIDCDDSISVRSLEQVVGYLA